MDTALVPNAVSMVFTAALSVSDIKYRRIPVLPVWLFLAGGIVYGFVSGTVINVVLSALPGAYFLSAAYLTGEKIGYGDGLVIMTIGVWVGCKSLSIVLAAGVMLSGLYGLFRAGIGWKKSPGETPDSTVPFVPFLFLGIVVRVLLFTGL